MIDCVANFLENFIVFYISKYITYYKRMSILFPKTVVEWFNISDKTLQNSFKSLFGFTPKNFMIMLKLNRAHEDLQRCDTQTTNVSDIVTKWGFSHFGRFAIRNTKSYFYAIINLIKLLKPYKLTYFITF